MNIEEYISSGILEAYASGDLSAEERTEVEENMVQYPALRDELLAIETVQEKLLMSMGVQPDPNAKRLLLEKVSRQPETKVVRIPSRANVLVWKYSVAASLAFALVASALAFNYYNKWRKSESSLTDLLTQNQRIASAYNGVNQRLDKIESDLKIMDNPGFRRAVLKGTDNAKESMAYVYWNENTSEVYISVIRLKELAGEQQYQLWAIIEGKPVDAGVFDSNVTGLLKMKDMSGVTAFAITIEPRGGRTSPTLETMQVMGSIIKG